MIKPPIVRVHDFFKCVSGPSSRTNCPNFSFFKNGITIGLNTTLIPNAISIGKIIEKSKFIFCTPYLPFFMKRLYFFLMYEVTFLFFLLYSQVWQNIGKNFLYNRSCNSTAIIYAHRFIDQNKCHYLRIIRRCKTYER